MTRLQRIRLGAAIVIVAFMLCACATTEITGSWKAQELTRPVESMLVMVRIEEETLRRMTEDRFSTALQDWGVNAVASYRVFPETVELEKEKVEEKSRELDLEGFLIVRVLEKEQPETKDTGYGNPNPHGYSYRRGFHRPHYHRWHSYYGYGYGYPYARTYPRESTVLRLETVLYRPAGPGLVWSARTETSYIDGLEEKLDEIAYKVVDKMARDNAI